MVGPMTTPDEEIKYCILCVNRDSANFGNRDEGQDEEPCLTCMRLNDDPSAIRTKLFWRKEK
jgi:hypothetical protein